MDPEDPTVIAETELLGAAASIEAAAKKLEQLKPRAKPKVFICSFLLSPQHHMVFRHMLIAIMRPPTKLCQIQWILSFGLVRRVLQFWICYLSCSCFFVDIFHIYGNVWCAILEVRLLLLCSHNFPSCVSIIQRFEVSFYNVLNS